MKKYFEGLKFGLLLQFAVGPMCLMVFNTAQNTGFLVALSLVIAIPTLAKEKSDTFFLLPSSIQQQIIIFEQKKPVKPKKIYITPDVYSVFYEYFFDVKTEKCWWNKYKLTININDEIIIFDKITNLITNEKENKIQIFNIILIHNSIIPNYVTSILSKHNSKKRKK